VKTARLIAALGIGLLAFWYALALVLDKVLDDPLASSKGPYPHDVAERFTNSTSTLADATWTTFSQALLGLAIGTAIAALTSIILVQARWIESAFMPYVFAAQMVPVISLIPIAQSIFKSDNATRLFIAGFITFFSITIAMVRGLKSAPLTADELMRSYNAGRTKRMRYLDLPASLPFFFAGMRIAAPLAITGSIIVDLMGATQGLGYLMLTALTFGPQQATMLWAATIIAFLLGVVMSIAVIVFERLVAPWQVASARESM
jgi:NitT/TauT family transport system permease protein